jgi:hypothetical protein
MNSDSTRSWQKNPALAWREIDGETVIISPGNSVMHELNDTGSFIWKQLDGQRSAAEIAALLRAEYNVAPETALADTEALLELLAGQHLVLPAVGESSGESPR